MFCYLKSNEPNLLLTGGQDGYIKLIDYRTNETQIASFRHDAEDKVAKYLLKNFFLEHLKIFHFKRSLIFNLILLF